MFGHRSLAVKGEYKIKQEFAICTLHIILSWGDFTKHDEMYLYMHKFTFLLENLMRKQPLVKPIRRWEVHINTNYQKT
jgi:hypothetical protein